MFKRLLTSMAVPLLLVVLLVGGLSAKPGNPQVVQARPLFPGGGTYTTFLNLTDTPGSYSGLGEQLVQVSDSEDGLNFTSGLYWDDTSDLLEIESATSNSNALIETTIPAKGSWSFGSRHDSNGDWILREAGVADRLIVDRDTGFVMVGPTGPATQLLEVRKDQNAQTAVQIKNNTAGTAAYASLELRTNSADGSVILYDNGYTGVAEFADKLVLYGQSTTAATAMYNYAELQFYTGGVGAANRRMVIDASGNLGVKDPTPSYDLDVAGTIRAQDDLRADDDLFVTGDAQVGSLTASGSVEGVDVIVGDALDVTGLTLMRDDVYVLGDLSVGDMTPDYKLDVVGTIRAQDDLIVDDWLDVNGTATFGDAAGGPFASAIYAERDSDNAIWGQTNSTSGAVAIYGAAPGDSSIGIMGEGDYGVIGWGYTNTYWSLAGGFFHQDVWVDQTLFVANSGALDQDAEAGKGNLVIGQSHSLPYGPLSGAAALYVDSGELYVLDAFSNTTQLSPHNAEGDWIFYSVDAEGNVTYINMIEVIIAMEELTGREFIHDMVPDGEKREYIVPPSRPIPQPLLPVIVK